MIKTPIQKIRNINENSIYIKRDDLINESFGGNKYRIANEFFNDMKNKKKDSIIAYGNSRSNLCRVIAYLANKYSVPCYIVSPNDDDNTRIETFNSFLVNLTNAKYIICNKNNVADTIQNLMNNLIKNGYNPYYINGDKYGKGNEKTPVIAYRKVIDEIKNQAAKSRLHFDYIFLASGTGMTQSGLIAGIIENNLDSKVVGISIARKKENQLSKLNLFLNSYFNTVDEDFINYINFEDDYLCGGYGKFNDEIKETIFNCYKENGIALDPTYTGKAFYGMKKYIEDNGIVNKNILFIHTGGTPLFFDFINLEQQKQQEIKRVGSFLMRIDKDFPVSLSSRVDIEEYSKKIIEKAVICKKDDLHKNIISIVAGYLNKEENQAYITIVGTLKQYRSLGYSKSLLLEFEEIAKKNNITSIKLSTHIDNIPAQMLYKKNGFIIKSIEGDVINMVKILEDK